MSGPVIASAGMPDDYDRLLGALDGLPDITRTKPTTIDVVPLMGVGGSTTFILHTVRQKDQGDTVFLRAVGASNAFRLILPPAITDAIARQRDALTAVSRRKGARQGVQTRKAKGIVPFGGKPHRKTTRKVQR